MSTLNMHIQPPQLPPPPGFGAFDVRDISGWYEGPTFDVVYCDPQTWRCYYIEDSVFSTRQEAQQMADDYNNGIETNLPVSQLYTLDVLND